MKKKLIGIAIVIIVLGLGATGGYFYSQKLASSTEEKIEDIIEGDVYLPFLLEIYDKIKENYWDTFSEAELNNFFKLGSEKLIGGSHNPEPNDKTGLKIMLENALKDLNQEQKKEFSAKLAVIVLQNLQPNGRSGLYTTQDEQALQNRIQNINPDKDLYQDLGLDKDAPQEKIEEVYQEKIAQSKTQEEIDKTKSAYQVLSDQNKKERYDDSGAEPTVFAEVIGSDIFHLHLKVFSPATFEEFQAEANKVADQNLDTLILDLRNNVGGSIDILPYFLGPFIGYDQYAYEFLHQGERTPFKTKVGWINSLVSYKKVIILIDSQSQSTAELMAAALKRYNVGVLIGQTTRGWGTIERVFPLDNQISQGEKYSIFLVHTLTLRDDNSPIEGNGVEPNISIDSSDWKTELLKYFDNQNLTKVVEQIWETDPNSYY